MALACSVFGNAIDYSMVRIRRRKWFPFQPRRIAMAPDGHIYFHPEGPSYCDDFSARPLGTQGFFIHEMTHVWQAQTRGKLYLVWRRHPLSSYSYKLRPGWLLAQYGIEQQAEIVRHAFLLRNGAKTLAAANIATYDTLVDFPGAG